MKKYLVLVLVFVLAISMGLSACSKSESTPTVENPDQYLGEVVYKDLPYHIEETEVTDEAVDSEMDMLVNYHSEETVVTEGVVEDGDTINVAFEGKIDGETFEGGSSESYDITVGTTSMIDGFVEGLVGKNIGDTVTLDLTFPEDYHAEDLQGKDVVFEVTIHNKVITETPELNDEFAQKYYDLENLDALREKVRGDLEKQYAESAASEAKSSLWNVILKNTEIAEYPEAELEEARVEMAALKEDYKAQATMYGMEWEEFLSGMMGTDEAGFDQMLEDGAKEKVRSMLIRDYIAAQENITYSESEYKDKLAEVLEQNNITEEEFKSYYNQTIEEYADEQGWRDSFLLDKVMDKVIELGREVDHEEFEAYIEEQLYADVETGGEVVENVEGETAEEEETEEEG